MKNLGEVTDIKDIIRKKDIEEIGGIKELIGNTITHDLRQPIQPGWMSIENYKPLKVSEYPELVGKLNTTNYYWEKLTPNENLSTSVYSFEGAIGSNIDAASPKEKVIETEANIIFNKILKQGKDNLEPINNKDFQEISNYNFNITNKSLWLTLEGRDIQGLLNQDKPVLALIHISANFQKYFIGESGKANNINVYLDHIIAEEGYGYGVNSPINLAPFKSSGEKYYIDNLSSFTSGSYIYNSFAWGTGMINENKRYDSSGGVGQAKERGKIGFVLEIPSNLKDLIIHRANFFERKYSETDEYFDISPHYFTPQYSNLMADIEKGNIFEGYSLADNDLQHHLGLKIFIGERKESTKEK